jgi:hypothetical protein
MDGANWTEVSLSPEPPGRYLAGVSFDQDHAQLTVFGGYGYSPQGGLPGLGDTWVLPTAPAAVVPKAGTVVLLPVSAALMIALFVGNQMRRRRRYVAGGLHGRVNPWRSVADGIRRSSVRCGVWGDTVVCAGIGAGSPSVV